MRKPHNVLVTGGSGFIGSAFVRHLLARRDFAGNIVNLDLLTYAGNPENVSDADPARYSFVRGDIGDERVVGELCERHAIDSIVNFAAESHVDRSIVGPGVFIQTNIVGTYALLEVVRKNPKLFFHHVSTDEVYGSLGETGLFREDSPYQPNSPYSASKAASDHLVRAYHHTYGIQTTLSNCSNNYGPYQFPEKLIPLMILNMLERKELPVYGDGMNRRDWLYVDDHVEAIWMILCGGRSGDTYNVGGRAEWPNLDIIRRLSALVSEETGADKAELEGLVRFVKDRPGHDRRYAIDTTKIESELGWKQRHNLDSGLRDTVRWYLANRTWVERVRTGAYRDWIETNYGKR